MDSAGFSTVLVSTAGTAFGSDLVSVLVSGAGLDAATEGAGFDSRADSLLDPDTSVSIIATGVPTSTVSCSLTNILYKIPAFGEGTSVSTLSVEISSIISSRSIISPSFFNHLVIVPS